MIFITYHVMLDSTLTREPLTYNNNIYNIFLYRISQASAMNLYHGLDKMFHTIGTEGKGTQIVIKKL